jgi:hypothetical protein
LKMVAKRWRMMSAPVLGTAALMMTPLLMNCGGMPGMPGLPGGCPADLNDPNAIMQANFGMKGELEGKVKAALSAGATLKNLAAEVEGDVALACGNLAKDLGASEDDIKPAEEGPGKKAEAACNVAVKMLGQVKAKAKISGKLNVKVVPPKCSASMDAMASCAGECSADVKGPEAKVECEGGEISGTCEAECKGSCTVEAGAKCEGTCSGSCEGSCEAEFSGKCDGACEGKCDGQASTAGDKNKGVCKGTCDGKCEAGAKGKCGGKCGGKCDATCEVKGQAKCEGTCSGGCSVEMKAPKCSGTVKPPEMSAECKASCDAKVNAKVECTPASVTLEASGAADAEAFAKLKGAIEKNLPGILKVTLGMKARLEGVVAQVKASIEGVKAAVSGGGSAALKIAGCFAASLKAQAEASVSINVSVKASASASGSAGAG